MPALEFNTAATTVSELRASAGHRLTSPDAPLDDIVNGEMPDRAEIVRSARQLDEEAAQLYIDLLKELNDISQKTDNDFVTKVKRILDQYILVKLELQQLQADRRRLDAVLLAKPDTAHLVDMDIDRNRWILKHYHTDLLKHLGEQNSILRNNDIASIFPNLRQRYKELFDFSKQGLGDNGVLRFLLKFLEKALDPNFETDSSRADIRKRYFEVSRVLELHNLAKQAGHSENLPEFIRENYPLFFEEDCDQGSIIIDNVPNDFNPALDVLDHRANMGMLEWFQYAFREDAPPHDGKKDGTFINSLWLIDSFNRNEVELLGLDKVPNPYGLGAWTEMRFAVAAMSLKDRLEEKYADNQNNLEQRPKMIWAIKPAEHGGIYDTNCVDFWLEVLDRKTGELSHIPIQIKFKRARSKLYKVDHVSLRTKTLSELRKKLREVLKEPKVEIPDHEFQVIDRLARIGSPMAELELQKFLMK